MPEGEGVVSAGELLAGLTFPVIPEGTPAAAFVMVMTRDDDGSIQWWTRASEGDDYNRDAFNWQLATLVASETARDIRAWTDPDYPPVSASGPDSA